MCVEVGCDPLPWLTPTHRQILEADRTGEGWERFCQVKDGPIREWRLTSQATRLLLEVWDAMA